MEKVRRKKKRLRQKKKTSVKKLPTIFEKDELRYKKQAKQAHLIQLRRAAEEQIRRYQRDLQWGLHANRVYLPENREWYCPSPSRGLDTSNLKPIYGIAPFQFNKRKRSQRRKKRSKKRKGRKTKTSRKRRSKFRSRF